MELTYHGPKDVQQKMRNIANAVANIPSLKPMMENLSKPGFTVKVKPAKENYFAPNLKGSPNAKEGHIGTVFFNPNDTSIPSNTGEGPDVYVNTKTGSVIGDSGDAQAAMSKIGGTSAKEIAHTAAIEAAAHEFSHANDRATDQYSGANRQQSGTWPDQEASPTEQRGVQAGNEVRKHYGVTDSDKLRQSHNDRREGGKVPNFNKAPDFSNRTDSVDSGSGSRNLQSQSSESTPKPNNKPAPKPKEKKEKKK